MKLLMISHSNIHPRQYFFAMELVKQGIEVMYITPWNWGSMSYMSLFDYNRLFDNVKKFPHIRVIKTGGNNIYNFAWDNDMLISVFDEFKPDLVYCASEWNSVAAHQVFAKCDSEDIPFILFTWENIHHPVENLDKDLIKNADYVICGNSEAKAIVQKYNSQCSVLPQVGVNTDFFKPINKEKKIVVISIGRNTAEKGVGMIKEAFPDTRFIHNAPYLELPELLSEARLHVTFPYDTPEWKEQSMGYVTAEAMSCGLSVITTDCGAIPEYLKNSTAFILKQCDITGLKEKIRLHLEYQIALTSIGLNNRDFIIKNYSNEIIAKKLIEVFGKVISR